MYSNYGRYPYVYNQSTAQYYSAYRQPNSINPYASYEASQYYPLNSHYNNPYGNPQYYATSAPTQNNMQPPIRDYGGEPFVVDIEEITKRNNNFRSALWTGEYFQLTLMSIDVGGEIGLEVHDDVDQFLRIEQGQGVAVMGESENQLDFEANVKDDYIIIIPAGYYHNLINTGNVPIKLYSIYAPPQHPFGTVHETKAESDAEEE